MPSTEIADPYHAKQKWNTTIVRAAIVVLSFCLILPSSGCGQLLSDHVDLPSLRNAYSTNQQPGIAQVEYRNDKMRQLMRKRDLDLSVFLVKGQDIDQAIDSTCSVLFDGSRGDVVEMNANEKAWIAITFGFAGSSPPLWTLHSVKRTSSTVRIFYREHGELSRSDDLHNYFAWIPLPQENNGKLTLELWNLTEGKATVTRSCEIRRQGR